MTIQNDYWLGFKVAILTVKFSLLAMDSIEMTSETHFHSECFVANVASVGVATSDFGWNEICVTAMCS